MPTGVVVFASLLVACTSAREPSDSSRDAPPDTPPPITLVANLDQDPVEWREVAFLPAGDSNDQIGLDPCFHCEALVPAALAVAPDGSYWIADSYKRRIAHYTEDGSFIEAIPVRRGPADLAFADDRLYVLFEEGGRTVVPVEPGAVGEPVSLTAAGKPMHVLAFVGGQEQLLAWFTDAEKTLGRFWAIGAIDPATGEVTPAPGCAPRMMWSWTSCRSSRPARSPTRSVGGRTDRSPDDSSSGSASLEIPDAFAPPSATRTSARPQRPALPRWSASGTARAFRLESGISRFRRTAADRHSRGSPATGSSPTP